MKEKKSNYNEDIVVGRNAIIEALKSDRDIEKIVIANGAQGSVSKIVAMAKEKGVIVSYNDKPFFERNAHGQNHQGVIAFVSAYKYSSIEDVFAKAEKSGEAPFVIILDNLEDPHNLGAILRTAECAGAHGVIITKRHSVGLTSTVAKAATGALEYMPCVKVTNIVQTIKHLKEQGMWICACDMNGKEYYNQDLTGSIGIVIGSEGKGISKLVKENCDFQVSIPMKGRITSLNASNAAAVIMYEVRKQRDVKGI